MEEIEMIRDARQGDLNAFNELVLNYQDQVFNLANRILDNWEMAEDITQDTFIRAFQKLHQFREGSFRSWLLKIAKNLCYDEVRTRKRHPHLFLEQVDKEDNINESSYWIRDSGPLPEEAVEMRELQNMLDFGLDQLALKYRTVVILIDIHRMDYREASRIAGIPVGTVKSRLARGRMQLGNYLKRLTLPNKQGLIDFDLPRTKEEYHANYIH